ncbi:hypothetical protein [Prosthecobacter sp.]|uniref:hypothetical protein n=1 Tax=Prosthecobacter sp. TaxID=1965333 RepID=UPI003783467E
MSTSLETLQASPARKSWLTTALLFGLPMGLLFSFQSGQYLSGMAVGLIAGALFASVITRFVSRQTQKFQAASPDFGTETALHSGPANHFKGLESVGGHLWLTDGRLHFRSHKMNLQNHEWTAPLADIASVRATRTLGLIRNGLLIRLSSGAEHRFVVNDNERWAQAIAQAGQQACTR